MSPNRRIKKKHGEQILSENRDRETANSEKKQAIEQDASGKKNSTYKTEAEREKSLEGLVKIEIETALEELMIEEDENKFYELTRIITDNFSCLTTDSDPFFFASLGKKTIKKIPNKPKAKAAYNRYIRMIEFLGGQQGNLAEQEYLEKLLAELEMPKNKSRESLLNALAIEDKTEIKENMALETTKKIIKSRIKRIKQQRLYDLGIDPNKRDYTDPDDGFDR